MADSRDERTQRKITPYACWRSTCCGGCGAVCRHMAVSRWRRPRQRAQLKIQKFSAEIFVQPDSALDVTETIEANFIGVVARPLPHDSRRIYDAAGIQLHACS